MGLNKQMDRGQENIFSRIKRLIQSKRRKRDKYLKL